MPSASRFNHDSSDPNSKVNQRKPLRSEEDVESAFSASDAHPRATDFGALSLAYAEVAAAPSATPKRASPRLQSERASPRRVEPPVRTLVHVSPRTFRRAWFVIVLAHSLCAAFVICVGITYLHLRHCVVMEAFMLYEVAVDVQYFPEVAVVYFSLASIHVWFLWDILSRSMCSRTYSLRRASVTTNPSSPSPDQPRAVYRRAMLQIKKDVDATFQICSSFLPRAISTALGSIWSAVLACYAAVDVRDKNYGHFFLFRELLQTSLQTYQAYRLSYLVPRIWMNNVIVTLLVLNCWSTPLIQYLVPRNVGKLRLGCTLVSVSLDFVSHVAIPIAIVWPYLLRFNYEARGFGVSSWYTDVWLTQVINEVQLLFVATFWDAVSKFLVAASVARWLDTITKLVRELPPQTDLKNDQSEARSTASIAPGGVEPIQSHAKAPNPPPSWKTRVENGGQRVLFAWGIVVLVAHLHAASIPVHPQCLLRTRPWFTTKPSCSLLGYDCFQEKSVGSEHEFDAFLQIFDLSRVGFLVVSQCPLLEFPARFQTLHQLLGMKLFRTTILSWDSETALTNKNHPKFLSIFFVDVNMTELPQGLLATDFPKKFLDIEFVQTNVTRLPNSLASIWPKGMVLILENSQFQELPSVLQFMEPTYLSLAKNNISVVPAQILESISPVMLFFAGNPVESLPSDLTHIPGIGWISLVATKVSFLPDWVD